MASRQKAAKSSEKNATSLSNGVSKHTVKIERQSSTGTDESKSAGQERGDGTTGILESPMKQCVNVIEKKIRNLVKRKDKLDEYKKTLKTGGTLNADQKEAIAKYAVVEQNLEFTRDLLKQFVTMSAEYEKAAKKQARRESIERHKSDCAKVKEIMKLLHVLNCLGTDEIRTSLTENKNIGLTTENLEQFDEFYKLVSISEEDDTDVDEQLTNISGHLVSYIDSQDKPVVGTTYKKLHELVERAADHVTSAAAAATDSCEAAAEVSEQQLLAAEPEEQQLLEPVATAEADNISSCEPAEQQLPQSIEIINSSLPRIDKNSLHNVINETASQTYPFGMKYQPTEVQGYSFLSSDDMSEVLPGAVHQLGQGQISQPGGMMHHRPAGTHPPGQQHNTHT